MFVNDNPSHPLRFERDGKVTGQFYNSWDKQYHFAEYVPYARPPSVYLCGLTGNYSPSRKTSDRAICAGCWDKISSMYTAAIFEDFNAEMDDLEERLRFKPEDLNMIFDI